MTGYEIEGSREDPLTGDRLSDRQIIDELLKDKGTSRKEVEDKVLAEKAEAKRKEKEARDADRKMAEEARERAKDELVRMHYGRLVMASIDGERIDKLGDLRNIPCPRCGGALPDLRSKLLRAAESVAETIGIRNHRSKQFWTIHDDLPCPHCHAILDAVTATISPEARELFGIASRRQ